MIKRFARWFAKNGLVASIVSLVVISVIVLTLYSTSPSLSKYVLDTIYYNITKRSAEHMTITAIGPISGTFEVGRTLKAGPITPANATVTYQWQRSADGSNFTDIPGATSGTYTITGDDYNCYIRVVAYGTGIYTGEVISEPTAQVVAGSIMAISEIIGTTMVGETLTAGVVTPAGATVTYQWQRSADNVTYVDIDGATSNTYTLKGEDINYYIRVLAIGVGAYTGTVASAPTTDPIRSGGATQITGIGVISGTARVGQTLTAGTVYPIGSTATYQWQRSTDGQNYDDIYGATSKSYLLVSQDYDCYIRVVATGSGNFSGVVESEPVGPVTAVMITAIGPINGTAKAGQTLTAGTITPSDATVTYQWQRCATAIGTYIDINGATSSSYKLTAADVGYYIKVTATGTGGYYGTVTSLYIGPVQGQDTPVIPIESIGPIAGTVQVGSTLIAGNLTPPDATATYRWQRCTTHDGYFEDIPGATGSTYTLSAEDHNFFIKVVATGSGRYSGTVESPVAGPVAAAPLISIGEISGTTVVGEELTAGTVIPYGATVTYQWQRSDSGLEGTWSDIVGAISRTYTLTGQDSYCYIRVVVTGAGAYTGTIASAPTKGRVGGAATPITGIDQILGTPRVGQVLTAGQLTPAEATATYQWQKSDTFDGNYQDIPYATGSTYVVSADDYGCYIKVVAIGSGLYTGSVTSAPTGPVTAAPITAIGAISGITKPGQTLAAGALVPQGATADYQWQRCNTLNGIYQDIEGATLSIYTVNEDDIGYYIRVIATGIGGYSGTVTSTPTGPVFAGDIISLNGIGPIIGTAKVGKTLAAGQLDPTDATVTYQWQRCTTQDGVYENIPGAIFDNYTLTADDYNYYIRVVATGTGRYWGTATSTATVPVAPAPITALSDIIGTASPGKTLTAGTVFPLGATVTYQWQATDDWFGITYSDIPVATSSSFTPHGELNGKYIRVRVTGTGAYTGTITSPRTPGRVDFTSTSITAVGQITGIPRVGMTLTAGDVTPYGASVTYQWQRSEDGIIYDNIPGAVYDTYTLGPDDYDCYIRVIAIGSGNYLGTVPSPEIGPVEAAVIKQMSAISGTTKVGNVITAGAIEPIGATVAYQWQRCDTPDGIYRDIVGATTSTYLLDDDDEGYCFKVVATGTGSYSGTVTSEPVGPAFDGDAVPLTNIGPVTGTARVGSTLITGELSPAGSTATYQWQRSEDGLVYQNIPGAVYSSYTLGAGDYDCYIRVMATGAGDCSGSIVSTAIGKVQAAPITDISGIIGNAYAGQRLAAGTVFPLGATVDYQWQVADDWNATSYSDIPGATSNFYTIASGEHSSLFLRVRVTGTGAYTGSVISAPTPSRVASGNTPLTGIGQISGTAEIGSTLTVGTLSPAGATATYQWQRSEDGSVYQNIPGAVYSAYELQPEDQDCYIRVVATGSGAYRGKVTSAAIGPVGVSFFGGKGIKAEIKVQDDPAVVDTITAIGEIHGIAIAGQTLTAGDITPPGATVDYQWQRGVPDGEYQDIEGATESTYTLTNDDIGYYIRVIATGTGNYSGTVTSEPIGPVSGPAVTEPLAGIGPITGTAKLGSILSAGVVTPAEATVVYQWQRCDTVDGEYNDIPGATGSSYTPVATDYGYYIRVVATGIESYTGTVTSEPIGPVQAATIDMPEITGIMVPVKGQVPDTNVNQTDQYTATLIWEPCDDEFFSDTVYSAIITITAKPGYTLDGVPENFFTVLGAETVTNAADSGVVTAVFPKVE